MFPYDIQYNLKLQQIGFRKEHVRSWKEDQSARGQISLWISNQACRENRKISIYSESMKTQWNCCAESHRWVEGSFPISRAHDNVVHKCSRCNWMLRLGRPRSCKASLAARASNAESTWDQWDLSKHKSYGYDGYRTFFIYFPVTKSQIHTTCGATTRDIRKCWSCKSIATQGCPG